MQRTIYPVGQGAFFIENLSGYTFIYDCGSTYTANARDTSISQLCSSITGNVTGMFISHFHADHINGIIILIQKLKQQNKIIERIFFPKITDANKIESLLNLAILGEDYTDSANMIKFINDPKVYLTSPDTGFDQIEIIEIEDETNQNREINNIEVPINLLEITSRTINSSTKLEINISHLGIKYNWQYIPFNYAPYTATQITNFMNNNGLTDNDFINIDDAKWTKIKQAASSCGFNTNETSMIILSKNSTDDYFQSAQQIRAAVYVGDYPTRYSDYVDKLVCFRVCPDFCA